MSRPFVVCHMVSSVDGKIDGSWFGTPEVRQPLMESNTIRMNYNCSATLYGATTMAETYAEGWVENLPQTSQTYAREDYLASSDVARYFVTIDSKGSIAYAGKYIGKKGRPRVHAVEVLLESVSDEYIAYLRSQEISYIFGGKEELDPSLVMQKLYDLFHIDRLMICGGGIVDYTFLQAGLIDELSLVIVPLTDGSVNVASVFDQSPYVNAGGAIAFTLLEAKVLPGDGVWLRYQPRNII